MPVALSFSSFVFAIFAIFVFFVGAQQRCALNAQASPARAKGVFFIDLIGEKRDIW
jgi:hypothetical protein